MKFGLKLLAVGVLAISASAAVAQERGHGGRGHGGPYADRPGHSYRPVSPPVHHRPQPPRRPYIVYTAPPVFQAWTPALPYARTYHDSCQRKAWRLRWFERQAGGDGYFSASERYELAALRRDVRRTCGDWRWRD